MSVIATNDELRDGLVRAAQRQFGLPNEEARDLVQQVLAEWIGRVRAGLSTEPRDPCHLRAILHRLLLQRFIDRLRRARNNGSDLREDYEDRPHALDRTILVYSKHIIQKEFQRLAMRRQVVLRAIYVEGLTQEEAGLKYGVDRRLISDWKRSFEARVQARAKEMGLID